METLKEVFARVLDVDKKEVIDNSSPENMSSWDSFNGPMLVSELENNFNIKFTMEEVMSIKNYKDIKELILKYGVKEGIDD